MRRETPIISGSLWPLPRVGWVRPAARRWTGMRVEQPVRRTGLVAVEKVPGVVPDVNTVEPTEVGGDRGRQRVQPDIMAEQWD